MANRIRSGKAITHQGGLAQGTLSRSGEPPLSVRRRGRSAALPVPFINRPHHLIKLLLLVGAENLADMRSRFHMDGLKLWVDLLLQVPRLLAGFLENLAELAHLVVIQSEIPLQVIHRAVRIKPVRVLEAAAIP
jgi:hypothetical protein